MVVRSYVTPIRTATNTALQPIKVGLGARAITITPTPARFQRRANR
jgi:hypothetical protein